MKPIHLPEMFNAEDPLLFKRVLLVEGDPALAAEVHDALDLRLLDVTVASDGPQAIRQIVQSEFDVILCDLTTRGFPAALFLEAVQRVRPELSRRLICIMDGRHTSPGIGAVTVWKPLDMQLLMEAIETVLQKEKKQQLQNAVASVGTPA